MSPIARTLPLVLVLVTLGCRASSSAPSPAAGGKAGAQGEKLGVLAPLGGTALALWPEAYAGAFTVLEVVPQGATVAEGDVIARLDARAIDEELRRAELERGTSELNHRALLERQQLEAAAAQSALLRARAGLQRSQRSLESWKSVELAFEQRTQDLSRRYQQANLEDQTDELEQLEKMYKGDELVDATEDIVLKRSRRGLALTKDQNALSSERVKHHDEFDLVLEREKREEDLRAQEEAVVRLQRTQALEAEARDDAARRSAAALAEQGEKLARLQRDRALFELKAPCAGVLLHGGLREYRPGRSPARFERGSGLATRSEVFVVAPPAPMGVTYDVADGERARFATGIKLAVRVLGGTAHAEGRAQLDSYPRTLSTGEATLEGSAQLDAPLAGARYGERVQLEPETQP